MWRMGKAIPSGFRRKNIRDGGVSTEAVFILAMKPPKTLIDAVRYFANPDNCREYLVTRRWPNGVSCPTCGSKSIYFDSTRTDGSARPGIRNGSSP